jgi:hypothetical protein
MSIKSIVLAAIASFMVHSSVDATLDVRTSPINPLKKVSPTEISIKENFAREFNVLAFALGLYYLDTHGRLSKDEIKEKLTGDIDKCRESFALSFDLDNIDFRKKGFTRYYPFRVNDKDYIIRIFDVNERHYLAASEVFYEGVFEESKLGFQILPGINEMLKNTKAAKLPIYEPAACSTNP